MGGCGGGCAGEDDGWGRGVMLNGGRGVVARSYGRFGLDGYENAGRKLLRRNFKLAFGIL